MKTDISGQEKRLMAEKKQLDREVILDSYRSLLGTVPNSLLDRLNLAQATGRISAVEIIEKFRDELIHRNPLDKRTQQLIHFAMLVARGEAEVARLHASGALKAGASLSDLQGVAETAAVVCGMPGYGLAVEAIAHAHPLISEL